MKNFVEELRWRGMLAQIMPGTEEFLQKGMVSAYLGTDPTADSLHIGHLCGIMMLRHLQLCGTQALFAHWWRNRYDWRPIRQKSRA